MKIIILFLTLFLTVSSAGQNRAVTDSIDKARFEEVNNFFMSLESMNLSYNAKRELQYKKLKSFIQVNPKCSYNAMFVTWGKYFDGIQIDSLYSLMDSSLQNMKVNARQRQKIRSVITPGKVFPPLILTDSLNKNLNLTDLKGKIVFIDIWASWCGPCRKEMPKLKLIYEKYKDKGFVVIAISLDDDKEKWIKAIAKDGQPWPQFCELKTWQATQMFSQWGIEWLPYNFLIDRQGKLVDKEINLDNLEEIISAIQQD
jgi:thiol-disulfide isomerase/thioredoxin